MYIRYDGKIEDREHGQKKIAGIRPANKKMNKQVGYKAGSGKFIAYWWGVNSSPIHMLAC